MPDPTSQAQTRGDSSQGAGPLGADHDVPGPHPPVSVGAPVIEPVDGRTVPPDHDGGPAWIQGGGGPSPRPASLHRGSVPPPDGLASVTVNRELSLLEFNRRVLEQARDGATPLLEQLRFLTICSTNLDEFFEIRVAGLKEKIALGVGKVGPAGLSPEEILGRIGTGAHALIEEQYSLLNDVLLPALESAGIRLRRRSALTPAQRQWVKRHFRSKVLPVLTPIGLDPAHPFPRIQNKSLNVIVSLEGPDAFGRSSNIAVLQVPRSLPRVIALPGDGGDFVLLSSVIHENISDVFPGMTVHGCYQFRVTRNSDLFVDEEEIDDLLLAVRGELSARNFGASVRLEIAAGCPEEIWRYLLDRFQLGEEHLYRVNGPVNLHRLAALYDLVDRPDLKYPPFIPATPPRIEQNDDIFAVIREGDVLLHHPYESFSPVLRFLHQAAAAPDVLAIKITLYRTGANSPIVDALIDAARSGKEVTAVIELRARFDEAANIEMATRLQEAGANVAYGVVGHKTHAKMVLVVRREGERLRRFVHLGTGNYHTRTARAYTDFGLMTCNRHIAEDVHRLFLQMTGLGMTSELRSILQSPFTLGQRLLELIDQETEAATLGRPSGIKARMNALQDPDIVEALYRAGRAKVPVDLVVRGICCLRPGIPNLSETIRVRSVVGRFLEHSRVFSFYAGGEQVTYLSSADWMERNLRRRVEAAFPIEDRRLKARVLREGLELLLEDNTQSWELQTDGTYRRLSPNGGIARSAQSQLLAELTPPTGLIADDDSPT